MNIRDYNLLFDQMPTHWDEGIPIGNGNMGCLLYGDNPLCLSVDRVDLWDRRPHPATADPDFNYQTLVHLACETAPKAVEKRNRLFENIYNELPYPSKITAGRIELCFQDKTPAVASLDLKNALVTVKGKKMRVEGFMHAIRPVGVFRIKGDFALSIHIPNYISKSGFNDRIIAGEGGAITPSNSMGYPPAKMMIQDGFTYYIQQTKTEYRYGLFIYCKKTEKETFLYYTVMTTDDSENFKNKAKKLLFNTAKIDYNKLKQEHFSCWHRYWKKSEISLPSKDLEKVYCRAWYLFGSCSRAGSYPMPLQGVWTADNDNLPPWRGDYHHDANTQMSYQGYLKANHWQEGRCFVDYLWRNRGNYRKFAKAFYGVGGWLIPGVSTIDGKPMGGWAQYSLSPTMSVWAAQSFDEYYRYSGDNFFLRKRAFPFLKGIADALQGLLTEKNGKLYLPLSSSPEIHDDTVSAYLTPNSNFDLSLLRFLFLRLTEYCEILQKDGTKYQKIYDSLDDFAVIDGGLALSKDETLTESHRHFSHLMALYPLRLIRYDTSEHKALYHNSMAHLERLGKSKWVGFSFAMAAQIYATMLDGDHAFQNLFAFADGFVGENGFHLNGDFKNKGYSDYHYRPFTLEALFGFCDALQEMLLQQHDGVVRVFPAVPTEWQTVSFRNLCAYNGLKVGAKMQNGKVAHIEFSAPKNMTVILENPFKTPQIRLARGSADQEFIRGEKQIKLYLKRGKTVLIGWGEDYGS